MDALIGHTGLVGGTIARARTFDASFRATDIDTMRGRSFDLVVCAGVRAEKWKANQDPDDDRAGIARLTDVLETVRIGHLVLISTVDVYPVPIAVDESTAIDDAAGQPYGRHRRELERFCTGRFDGTIVRLPGLFGRGLKKNAIYDLLHDNAIAHINPQSAFQFYDLSRLWTDIEQVRSAGIALVNLSTEPVVMGEVASEVFHRTLSPLAGAVPARYDMRSIHAERLGGRDGYWYDAAYTRSALARFVADEGARLAGEK